MSGVLNEMTAKGYMPLAGNDFAAIGLEGRALKDFWMFTNRTIEDGSGNKIKQSVRVSSLKEAALHYWRDRWVPVKAIDEDFLIDMEEELRSHRGLKKEGVQFPEVEFLKMPEALV